MGYHEQAATRRVTNRNEPALADRMTGIVKGCGQRVIEDGNRLIERYPVFLYIAFGLRP